MYTKRFSSFVKNRALGPFRDPNLKLGVQKADCHIALDIAIWELSKWVEEMRLDSGHKQGMARTPFPLNDA